MLLNNTLILLEEQLWDEKGLFREHGLFRIVYLADSDIGRMPRTRIRLSLGTNEFYPTATYSWSKFAGRCAQALQHKLIFVVS